MCHMIINNNNNDDDDSSHLVGMIDVPHGPHRLSPALLVK